jgi:hypothetical protein
MARILQEEVREDAPVIWIFVVIVPVAVIGGLFYLWLRIRSRGRALIDAMNQEFGTRIRLVTGCGIVCPPNRVPGVLALLDDRIAYRSLISLAGGEGEIPLPGIAKLTWEHAARSEHQMARKYRNASVIGITTREGDVKIFVVAESLSREWEALLEDLPGFKRAGDPQTS